MPSLLPAYGRCALATTLVLLLSGLAPWLTAPPWASAQAATSWAGRGVGPGVWPLQPQPVVVHGFDPPEVRWGPGHRGVDLAGHVGQPVRAALAGTVSFAGRVAGRGVVVVDHGMTRTTYQPVTATVGRGAVVARGQVLGTLAWFGTHCLPAACLHWGLVAGESYLDPLSILGGPRPVRLLPLAATPTGAPLLSWGDPLATPSLPPPALVALAGAVVATDPAATGPVVTGPGWSAVRRAGVPGGTPPEAVRR